MTTRWTIEELKTITPRSFIRAILEERKSKINMYAPLAKAISRAQGYLDRTYIAVSIAAKSEHHPTCQARGVMVAGSGCCNCPVGPAQKAMKDTVDPSK